MKILVTGASGKTGKAILRALKRRGYWIRALVRQPQRSPDVEDNGAADVVVADLADLAGLQSATRGIDAMYHIAPNVSPWEVVFGKNAIAAAQANKVGHFVYHSVFHPNTQKMPHHWLKLRVEEALFESDLPYTILQPAAYMQNILAQWESIKERSIYTTPYPIVTRMSLVDLEDVAEVASLVLGNASHFEAIYELAGPDRLSQVEIATIMSQILGQQIVAQEISIDDWLRQAQSRGLTGYPLRTLLAMFDYYRQYGFCGNSNVLGYLLNRKPTDFRAFLQKCLNQT